MCKKVKREEDTRSRQRTTCNSSDWLDGSASRIVGWRNGQQQELRGLEDPACHMKDFGLYFDGEPLKSLEQCGSSVKD